MQYDISIENAYLSILRSDLKFIMNFNIMLYQCCISQVVGIRTNDRYLDISVLNICDISVLDISVLDISVLNERQIGTSKEIII